MGIDAQMLVKTRQSFTPKEVRRLAVEMCEAFGSERFWVFEDMKIYDTNEKETGEVGRHALSLESVYRQDGDDIVPEDGETFIEVHLATRYYGEGYERGDLPFIIAVARYLEARIPDARVFYGGDSSGVCAEPFDQAAREVLWDHFVKQGHRPYSGALSTGRDRMNQYGMGSTATMFCGFCECVMTSTGGGRDRSFFACPGCGKHAVQHIDGRVIHGTHHEDIFKLSQQLDGAKA